MHQHYKFNDAWWKPAPTPEKSLREKALDKAFEIERSRKQKDGSYSARDLDVDQILFNAKRMLSFLTDGCCP